MSEAGDQGYALILVGDDKWGQGLCQTDTQCLSGVEESFTCVDSQMLGICFRCIQTAPPQPMIKSCGKTN